MRPSSGIGKLGSFFFSPFFHMSMQSWKSTKAATSVAHHSDQTRSIVHYAPARYFATDASELELYLPDEEI